MKSTKSHLFSFLFFFLFLVTRAVPGSWWITEGADNTNMKAMQSWIYCGSGIVKKPNFCIVVFIQVQLGNVKALCQLVWNGLQEQHVHGNLSLECAVLHAFSKSWKGGFVDSALSFLGEVRLSLLNLLYFWGPRLHHTRMRSCSVASVLQNV